ncbi:sigma 54-interacting transcriptional regulator [Crassaminicella profunda]|uniref:sigma 54-interacting transcriptional regulator n=1 Tax=Crassaminicella profunda TaxID=1286698 RepID=UPI001CA66F41|nr:sigma 54-interacting transcriptional regulator [Crassaminicella profunda]QZY55895.1 sigma 54-interacting transcriptional regulator [Crassaminicella profunda]
MKRKYLKRKLVIICIQEGYMERMLSQLKEIFSDKVEIRGITVKNLMKEKIDPDEILLLSNQSIVPMVKTFFQDIKKYILIKRSVNLMNMKKLWLLPKGQKILVINDTDLNTKEVVEELRECIFEHDYYGYPMNNPIPKEIDYVITPGEMQFIPEGVKNVIDIGPRVIDLETIMKLFEILGFEYDHVWIMKRYMKALSLLTQDEPMDKMHLLNKIDTKANYYFSDMISYSEKIENTIQMAKKMAKDEKNIHIYGEIGTGKTLLAQAIHNESKRKEKVFIMVDCSLMSEKTLENKLFGYEDEASKNKVPSLLELADGGTLCLEAINGLSFKLQNRLLQVIKENKLTRNNGIEPILIDVRLITTSTVNILGLVKEGEFSKELFYRMSPYALRLHNLNEENVQLEALIEGYLKNNLKREELIIEEDAIQILKNHKWRGNVRELFNVLAHIACMDVSRIDKSDLPFYIKTNEVVDEKIFDHTVQKKTIDVEKMIKEIERRGFLEESLKILNVFHGGKEAYKAYGRLSLKKKLEEIHIYLTEQQLRLKLEWLKDLGLLNVRKGRAGTILSRKGKEFLKELENRKLE